MDENPPGGDNPWDLIFSSSIRFPWLIGLIKTSNNNLLCFNNCFFWLVFRNWMNSLGLSRKVNWLYLDTNEGLIYFQIFDIIQPGIVDWSRVKKWVDIMIILIHTRNTHFAVPRRTVSDWVPKKDSANFESDAFLWFAYVVNMSKIATLSGRFWIFG